ncbi:hypothetical protein P3T27_003573 [Kitasatospora sp. MAA19]|uniref:hypothetical protein n=1 Tax=Kitasatospora sp. MAA19 TaxID=3035090 RepID=UPI00247663E7|nr:hypothetical protein [Kitasatospora sp. MAA19]MDH6706846.1 hypothetical protein [Kitasatospora sp. MAA19]
MDYAAGPPLPWHVALDGGVLIELWADGYGVEDGAYLFSVLARATQEEQRQVDVVARTPADPQRVGVAVARFPAAAVRDVHTATTRAADGRCACPG